MKMKIIAIAYIAAVILFVAALAYLLFVVKEEAEERTEYIKLASVYVTVNEGAAESSKPLPDHSESAAARRNRLSVDFDALSAINSDIVGWIFSEGTPINYPIVQARDNYYYLKRSFEKEASKLGAIFLDAGLSMDESDVVILYGHNMGSGRNEMFSSLKRYEKAEYLIEHNEIITLTKDGDETLWNVFAVLHVNTSHTGVNELYRMQNFFSDAQYISYIQLIKEHHLYDSGIEPYTRQKILVLSTCVGNGVREMRRIVFAMEDKSLG